MSEAQAGSGKGSVLVIGGGIAGIQSSLDLAEAGFRVHLVEKSPAIGGTMAGIDKTFPTNDCAMCIMSPKLVDSSRHLNIDLLTYSEVVSVDGGPGDFSVRVRRKSRSIDEDKCTGCGDCAEACPVSRSSEFDRGLAERKAVYRPYPQAAPNVFTIERQGQSPCTAACPAGCNAHGYVALIRDGKFEEALELIRERIPIPAVCGRVCGFCEDACNRAGIDASVQIRALKRFASDHEMRTATTPALVETGGVAGISYGEKGRIAIIGSGPAGLTAAYDLAKDGYHPVVFENQGKAGGMLRYGIPEYRLPDDVLDYEIGIIQAQGVEIRTNSSIGGESSPASLLGEGFGAVFVAVGTQASYRLGIEGEDLEGVVPGIDFLRGSSNGINGDGLHGKSVAVIGGGNTAIDTVRTALRRGAREAFVVYRRTREQMPVSKEEIEAAEAEGVKIHYLLAPVAISGSSGKVDGLICSPMRLGPPDASGRRRPVPTEGEPIRLDVDLVYPALGQGLESEDFGAFLQDLEVERDLIKVDPVTLATKIPGVFAGGDAVGAGGYVVHAIAHGHEAALSIDRFLKGEDLTEGRSLERKNTTAPPPVGHVVKNPGTAVPARPVDERILGFEEVELGFTDEEAIAEARRCMDCGVCSECLQCAAVCKADAVDHSIEDQVLDLQVGSIIVASGSAIFDPSGEQRLGYGHYPDVVTSVQFERILSASGPYAGHLKRPSDGATPRRIAFVQCVGSRDPQAGFDHCSSVCCMYAIKEAVIAMEHESSVEATVFYMDIRAFGKDFERYYDRAKNEYGVRFLRARVSDVYSEETAGGLTVEFETESGGPGREQFDMVVLSVGFEGGGELRELGSRLGTAMNRSGFIASDSFNSVQTGVPGIFVCGPAQEPKDIPETVTQASAAAGAAAEGLAEHRFEDIQTKSYPPERDVSGEPPRVGVFVCNCGVNIGGVVDVPSIVDFARSLPDVVHAEENLYTCSEDTQSKIKEVIRDNKLNRVIVASCTPRTHQPLFQETIREAGLNPYLFEMANIRDQCSWVHREMPQLATDKARDLLRMAVAKVRLIEPLSPIILPVTQRALVVGGGPAGMSAALSLGRQGFEVELVEKEPSLGGMLNELVRTVDGKSVAGFREDLLRQIADNENVIVNLGSSVERADGFVGNFQTTILGTDGSRKVIDHGATVIATGAVESSPGEYLYGDDPRVLTGVEFEKRLEQSPAEELPGRAVFIQCVGSREPEHQYCSRECCNETIKNALRLKDRAPDSEIYVLYRDIRSYGFSERYYTQARERGVIFLRYESDDKPEVTAEKGVLSVSVNDGTTGARISMSADLLVLAARMDPLPENESLSRTFRVPLNQDGFFMEAHAKLRPVDFASDGVYLAGTAHGPKTIAESIAQGKAAAARAATILSKEQLETEATVASVAEDVCSGCGICQEVCEYKAVEVLPMLDGRRIAVVNEGLCKGCGACAGACPSSAMVQKGFRNDQVLAALESALLAV